MAPKYQEIKDDLARTIVRGDYSIGEKLPTCRELAEKWSVSYLTANKAIKKLAEENFVDLNHGQGIFVRWRREGIYPSVRKIRVFGNSTAHPNMRFFLEQSMDMLKRLNWDVEVVTEKPLKEIIELVRDQSCYSLLFGYYLITYDDTLALCSAGRERLVVLGERYERLGVSSSCVDFSQVIRLAMNHLQGFGKNKVALLCSNSRHPDEAEYAAVWRNLFSLANPEVENTDRFLFDLKISQFDSSKDSLNKVFKDALLDFLREQYEAGILQQLDGIICTDDEKAVIVNSFCHDMNLRVPEDISLIAVNDSGLANIVRPQLTTIDTNLSGQLRNAISILESKVAGRFDGIHLRCVEPKLVCRESTPQVVELQNNSKMMV